MDTFEAIESRRAIKSFDPNYTIPKQEIDKILSAAILSPTSYNIQNWRFVIITNKETKAKLRAASWNQAQVTDASVVIVLCADLLAWKKDPARYWKNAPKATQDYLVPAIIEAYEGQDQFQRDEAIRSCGMAAQTIMLAAKAMNYDSCPMIGFIPEEVAKIINLPQDHIIPMMITIGKALKPANPRGGQLSLDEIVVEDHF
ncbi:MAG: nitroreductase family protein [Nitrososphaeria archaeon]|nr:nitroreductase family protein [Nitrososphaeria archaeon]NDB52095.1 nitroreductase family protein [Nitrosopumilaceae archaeon]NDB88340.1 nitroreductase family protein [Nitrososphaerota archaeon]NDB90681.1 nitroreductase family protein [Nitrososphaerota archaeon]NDB92606.1 nitroreductase family protein [Nitrososphaeria archaeon]